MINSEILLNRAKTVIPGGVNSPVRAFNAVEGSPPFIAKAEGCWMVDVDGNRYLDLIGSWGPMIVGHCNPVITSSTINKVPFSLHKAERSRK